MKLFLFNPENDLALANGDVHFIPPRSARVMAADLGLLPLWWAGEGDGVCVSSAVRAETFVRSLPVALPRIAWCGDDTVPAVDELCPWGWNPMLLHALRRKGFPESLLLSDGQMEACRRLSGRQTAVELLDEFRQWTVGAGGAWSGQWCGESFFCTREEEIVEVLGRYPETILKAPWSGSGKGLRLGRTGWQPPLCGWCRNLLASQGGVVVEPLYDKVADFAMEFYSDGNGKVGYQGLSLFSTTGQGAYQNSTVASESVKEARLHRWIPVEVCRAVRDWLAERLSVRVGTIYRGFLGVDMMICCTPQGGGYCIHPCVEVNLRMTMGMVAVWLERWLAPGAEAEFVVDYVAEAGWQEADHIRRQKVNPLRVDGGRLVGGYCALTPVYGDTHYRAWMQIRQPGTVE